MPRLDLPFSLPCGLGKLLLRGFIAGLGLAVAPLGLVCYLEYKGLVVHKPLYTVVHFLPRELFNSTI